MTPETWTTLYKAMMIGSMMGVFSALLGVGGGAIAVPALVYLMGFDMKVASGTSLAAMVVVSLTGASKHYAQGNVNLLVACGVAFAGMLFSVVGAWLNKTLPSIWIQRIFAIFFACMAIQMFWRTISTPEKPAIEAVEEETKSPQ